MSVIVYTKDNCPYCVKAKTLLTIKGIDYNEMLIGSDMTREEFMSIFPEQKTVPLIIINGVKIGGFDKLTEWFDAGNNIISEGSA